MVEIIFFSLDACSSPQLENQITHKSFMLGFRTSALFLFSITLLYWMYFPSSLNMAINFICNL